MFIIPIVWNKRGDIYYRLIWYNLALTSRDQIVSQMDGSLAPKLPLKYLMRLHDELCYNCLLYIYIYNKIDKFLSDFLRILYVAAVFFYFIYLSNN